MAATTRPSRTAVVTAFAVGCLRRPAPGAGLTGACGWPVLGRSQGLLAEPGLGAQRALIQLEAVWPQHRGHTWQGAEPCRTQGKRAGTRQCPGSPPLGTPQSLCLPGVSREGGGESFPGKVWEAPTDSTGLSVCSPWCWHGAPRLGARVLRGVQGPDRAVWGQKQVSPGEASRCADGGGGAETGKG